MPGAEYLNRYQSLPVEATTPSFVERFNKDSFHALTANIGGMDFKLPIVDIGGIGIAYLDCSPEKNPGLEEKGSDALAKMIVSEGIEIAVGVSSSKSEGLFRKAIAKASFILGREVKSLIIHRGPLDDFSNKSVYPGKPIPIDVITGSKYLAISRKQAETLQRWMRESDERIIPKIGLIDDVISTGATTNGMRQEINRVLGLQKDNEFDIFALMEEFDLSVEDVILNPETNQITWCPKQKSNHHTEVIAPVLIPDKFKIL